MWDPTWSDVSCRAHAETFFNVRVSAFEENGESIPGNISAVQVAGPVHQPWQVKTSDMSNPSQPALLLLREGTWRIRAESPPFRSVERELQVEAGSECTVRFFTSPLPQRPIA